VPTPIRIRLDDVELSGELGDGAVARAVVAALPIEETLRSFGDSYYVESPVDVPLEPGASDAVGVGDIAYWPPALAVAFFFGPTPETPHGSQVPRAASDVTVIGRVHEPQRLAGCRQARRIRIAHA
jgi:hypothetical protein